MIVHQLTALSERTRPAPLRPHLRGRRTGSAPRRTDHLLAAGRAVGIEPVRGPELRRLAVRPDGRTGEDRGRPARSRSRRTRCARRYDAIRHLEDAVTGAGWTEGVVLRYGGFYGPGTSLGRGGRRDGRDDPRSASSRWSATAPACGPSSTSRTRPRRRWRRSSTAARGIYNIVDDEPAPVAEWLPAAGRARGRASRRGMCRAGSAGCSPARPRRS